MMVTEMNSKEDQDDFKKLRSYLGKIPSKILNEEQYSMFLDIASPEELELDIITRETLYKIIPPDYSAWQASNTFKCKDT